MHLYMKVSVRSPGHEVTTTKAYLPCQKAKGFIEVWWGSQKDKSHFSVFYFAFEETTVSGSHTNSCLSCTHSHGRGVSFGDACIECTGCQPLHWAKCSAAEIALVVWAAYIQIQKYKTMAIVDACNCYLLIGKIMWS